MLIVVSLHRNRNRAGRLHLEDEAARVLAGPFYVAARANDEAARRFGNPHRIPTLPYGDTPLGTYRVLRIAQTPPHAAAEYGPHGVIAMEGIAGDAALAEANGRFELLIQGGDPGTDGTIGCTTGSLRMRDDDIRALLEAIPPGVPLRCTISERAADEPPDADEPPIDSRAHCADPDESFATSPAGSSADAPPRVTPWVTPRYVRATTMAVVAHGEYDPDNPEGTHIEIRDELTFHVRNGFHLEIVDGHLTEVPNAPGHEPGPGPTQPTPPGPTEPGPTEPTPPGSTPGPSSGPAGPGPGGPPTDLNPPSTDPGGVTTLPHDPHEPHDVPEPSQPGTGPAPGPAPGPPSVAQLAQQLRSSGRVAFATSHVQTPPDNATAQQNIDDAAAGNPVARSNPPGGTVMLSSRMLTVMNGLTSTFRYSVSEIAGGSHHGQAHFQGRAFDVNVINDRHVDINHPDFRAFEQRCMELGGPGTIVRGPGDDAAHATHIHCQFP